MPASRVDKFSAGWTNCRSPISHVDKDMVEQSHPNPYSVPGYGRSGSGAKPKELMLHGSLSGLPWYASILLDDEQGISSEMFRSLSCFISSRGARGVGGPGT